MAMLIKDRKITSDLWVKIDNDNVSPESVDSFSILPLSVFTQDYILSTQHKTLGAWFNADIELETLTPCVLSLPLLCINVDDFNHGQIFSIASMIKQNFNYQGELRATGNLTLDQLPYLHRCGINSFSILSQYDCEYALFVLQQAPAPSRFQTPLNNLTLDEKSL